MSGLPTFANLVLCILAAVLGAAVGLRAHRREPISEASKVLKHSPHLWTVLLLPLLVMAVHTLFEFNSDWEWLLPFAVQYYYGPVAWGLVLACFTYFAGFGGSVFVTTGHPKRIQLGAAIVMLFSGVQLMHFQATQLPTPELGPPQVTPSGLVLQSNSSTCVPAAAASLLNQLGDPRTEAELVKLFDTRVDGTSPSQLVRGMRELGYDARAVNIERESVDAVTPPAVLFVQQGTHAMTLLAVRGRRIDVWDPDAGKILLLSRDQFRILAAGAHAVQFTPTDQGAARRVASPGTERY